MGLLDALQSPDGQLGLGLLAAAGPSATPMSFGQRLSGAMQQFQAAKIAEEERRQKAAMQALQAQLIQAQIGDTYAQQKQREAAATKQADAMAMLNSVLSGKPQQNQYDTAGSGLRLGGQTESMTPRAGGLEGATPEQIAALKVAGFDLRDLWNDAQTGKKLEAGNYYVKNGKREYLANPKDGISLSADGRVSLIPGAAEAQAGLAGATAGATTAAQEAAKAPYTLVDSYDPSTQRPIKVPLSQVVQQPQAPQPSMMSAVLADMKKNGIQSAQYNLGGVKGSLGNDWPSRTSAGAQGIPTGPSQSEKSAATATDAVNNSWIKSSYEPVLAAGDSATKILDNVRVARKGLELVGSTSWGTPAKAQAAAVLNALGVPQAEQLATGSQIFQQAASTKLWETLNAAKGPQTEGDSQRAQKLFASLGNTAKANQFILDLAEATAQRDAKKAAWYRDALPLGRDQGDMQMIDRKWQQREPSIFSMPSMQKWGM